MTITLDGQVHLVHETEQKTDTFSVREAIIVVDPSSQYPAYITIQANNDKASLFDGLQRGQQVRAHLNLNGRLYDDQKTGKQRSFNSLVCWKIELLSAQPVSTPPPTSGMTRDAYNANPANQAPKAQAPSFDDDGSSDLPF